MDYRAAMGRSQGKLLGTSLGQQRCDSPYHVVREGGAFQEKMPVWYKIS